MSVTIVAAIIIAHSFAKQIAHTSHRLQY